MFERNWPVDNVIKSYFGLHQDLNATGEVAFKKQLYQSMIAQSLFIKAAQSIKKKANNAPLFSKWLASKIWI